MLASIRRPRSGINGSNRPVTQLARLGGGMPRLLVRTCEHKLVVSRPLLVGCSRPTVAVASVVGGSCWLFIIAKS
jgi:hypothetical protein